ncbi:MAG: pentapeptide repeat-containing protein [Acidobacteriota bacterium]|nr:pentapeptide repeat-containing protein [Acidobacteriota bacterium]
MARRKPHRRTRRLPAAAWEAFTAGDARAWKRWREQEPDERVDLRGLKADTARPGAWLRFFDLRGADLRGVQFVGADLGHADLRGARFDGANLGWARLAGADCREADFGEVELERANLRRANLAGARCKVGSSFRRACLEEADLSGSRLQYAHFDQADLSDANLTAADLCNASFERADLSGAVFDESLLRNARFDRAVLYHTSFKGADLRSASATEAFALGIEVDERTRQKGLIGSMQLWFSGTGRFEAEFTRVDDLRAASLLALLGERGSIASLITAGTASVVLVLGRFSRRRKAVLKRLSDVLRTKGRIPIVFDFPGPEDRELSDTVRVLAALSEFLVVDLSDPRSVPLELQATVPGLMIPVVPIVQAGKPVFAMFQDLQRRYFWVLPPVSYTDKEDLAAHVGSGILRRVRKVQRQIERRRKELIAPPTAVGSLGPPEPVDKSIDWIRRPG